MPAHYSTLLLIIRATCIILAFFVLGAMWSRQETCFSWLEVVVLYGKTAGRFSHPILVINVFYLRAAVILLYILSFSQLVRVLYSLFNRIVQYISKAQYVLETTNPANHIRFTRFLFRIVSVSTVWLWVVTGGISTKAWHIFLTTNSDTYQWCISFGYK